MKPYESNAPKRDQIRQMFNNIAPKYDLLNHLLSFGVDRCWRKRVVKHLGRSGAHHILDVATGTGDLAISLARHIDGSKIVGADLSEQMIEVAEVKVSRSGLRDKISLQVADVEQLPFEDRTFDAVTVAFGVRNFQNIPLALVQMQRVLKEGGQLVVLEFSRPKGKLFGALYGFYFHNILPMVGGWISKDSQAYRYLPESVDEFASVARFLELMGDAGFGSCSARSLFGGVAHIYIGKSR